MEQHPSAPPQTDIGPSSGDSSPSSASPNAFWVYRLFLFSLASLAVYLFVSFDTMGLLAIAMAILGLGFVIFIHELGHYLVAKWCDVKVEAFSIGLGPALPGCKFQWGETSYQIGCVPLGGYVQILGEGGQHETDGPPDPRSYPNKPVWQRMAIISAGVVMNVILAFVCFTFVFMSHGVEQAPMTIGKVETGSPAWHTGLRSGDVIHQIGSRGPDPDFGAYLSAVIDTQKGERLHFVFGHRNAPPSEWTFTDIEPRCDAEDKKPVTGVSGIPQLHLPPRELNRSLRQGPWLPGSAASTARQWPLDAGSVVLATTDPDAPDRMKALPPGPDGKGHDWRELTRRMQKLAGQPMTVEYRPSIKPKTRSSTIELPPTGFLFDDTIVGTTDADQGSGYDPLQVSELASEPAEPGGERRDYFELQRRMKRLAGKPLVLRVRRGGEDPRLADVLLPPAFQRTFGARLEMGAILAVRESSPAARAGVQPGDVLEQVEMTDSQGQRARFVTTLSSAALQGEVAERILDPVRLPGDLLQWAMAHPGSRTVRLTVRRGEEAKPIACEASWDEDRQFVDEVPGPKMMLLGIPALGIGYQASITIAAVEAGSPAARAGLVPGDVIQRFRVYNQGKRPDQPHEPESWEDVKPGQGFHVFHALRSAETPDLELTLARGATVPLQAETDETRGNDAIGLALLADVRLHKAATVGEAIGLGVEKTGDFLAEVYRNLRSILTGRVSPKMAGGPLTIAWVAYSVARDNTYQFIFFLAMISANLAVVNFLPIPVLDGGHMVFLIYEGLRGKPAPDSVRRATTYVGLAMLLGLMAFVLYLDVSQL